MYRAASTHRRLTPGWIALGLLLPVLLHAAPLQRWLYCSQNLWVDANVDRLEALWQRAAAAGYTHVLVADSKFAKLGDLDARYFTNITRLQRVAARLRLEIVPAVFPIGYSNDLLWHDPNLVEALPVHDVPLVVSNGVVTVAPQGSLQLPGGDFSDLRRWSWKDDVVVADSGTARISDPNGRNARIVQRLAVQPFRQYHVSVRVKTADFRGTVEAKVLAGNAPLNFDALGVQPTQDWATHHVVFNSLTNTAVALYLGCWGGTSGSLWFDDAAITEIAFVNLVRRDGAPLVLRRADGSPLTEGKDFPPFRDPKLGVRLWPGSYEVFHEPPVLRLNLPDGTPLRASYFHAVTVHDDQAMICPSEPRTIELLRDQARRLHAAWNARGYFMSHDEIRVLNWCAACQRRQLDAGALLADNVRTCIRILRDLNPGGRIYVWSDMFDPNHNAHDGYYLVRGNLAGSWEGLDPGVVVVPWYFEQRAETLRFFAGRGHAQLIAGYYDAAPERIRDWLDAARSVPRVEGVMYTTWANRYEDLEAFAHLITPSEPH